MLYLVEVIESLWSDGEMAKKSWNSWKFKFCLWFPANLEDEKTSRSLEPYPTWGESQRPFSITGGSWRTWKPGTSCTLGIPEIKDTLQFIQSMCFFPFWRVWHAKKNKRRICSSKSLLILMPRCGWHGFDATRFFAVGLYSNEKSSADCEGEQPEALQDSYRPMAEIKWKIDDFYLITLSFATKIDDRHPF